MWWILASGPSSGTAATCTFFVGAGSRDERGAPPSRRIVLLSATAAVVDEGLGQLGTGRVGRARGSCSTATHHLLLVLMLLLFFMAASVGIV